MSESRILANKEVYCCKLSTVGIVPRLKGYTAINFHIQMLKHTRVYELLCSRKLHILFKRFFTSFMFPNRGTKEGYCEAECKTKYRRRIWCHISLSCFFSYFLLNFEQLLFIINRSDLSLVKMF